MRVAGWMTPVLIAALVSSALAVVYSKHQSRRQFMNLQTLQSQRDELIAEWGRLQLEQSTWATHGRIESSAHTQLNMRLPEGNAVVIVKE